MKTTTAICAALLAFAACSSPTEPREPRIDLVKALICADSLTAPLRPDCGAADTTAVTITITNPNSTEG